jgi:arylsulfatase A-like enzyme
MDLRRLALLFVATALLASAGCGRDAKPPIILITLESVRADQLRASFEGEPVSPILAEVADESIVFERGIATAPWTTPSTMSMHTGYHPFVHGVEEHDRALSSRVVTLAERFKAAGYKTAAMTPAITLRPEYGYGRGFDVYDHERFGHNLISSPALIAKTQHWVQQWKDEPFFVWVHLWDPHYNYIPEPPYDETFRRGTKPENEDVQCLKWVENPMGPDEADYLYGLYQGEIRYTDDYVGKLLDTLEELGLRDEVVLAVVGDHGESFLEHGWLGHTNRVDDVNVHVPVFLNWRGRIPAGTVDHVVSTASIGRTLLRLAGLPHEDFGDHPELPVPGLWNDTAPEEEHWPISRTIRRGCWHSLHAGDLKYTLDFRTCTEHLYDLAAEPSERTDLAGERPDDLARLRGALLERLRAEEGLGIPIASMPNTIVEESQAALRSLGYVAGGGGDAGGQNADVGCARVTPRGVDGFGDITVDPPCDEGGELACLERLSGS